MAYDGQAARIQKRMNQFGITVKTLLAAMVVISALSLAHGDECPPATVGYRVMNIKGRSVAIWYPAAAHPSQYAYSPRFSGLVAHDAPASLACGRQVPLVVFSHGDLGCGLQSIAFTEELARHGYVVAAPDHADAALCHTTPSSSAQPRKTQPNFFKPEAWSEKTFAAGAKIWR